MGFLCEGEIWIPQDEWVEFFMRFVPGSSATDACVAFGVPEKDGSGDLVVPFAMNTECPPSEQSPPPAFLRKDKGERDE